MALVAGGVVALSALRALLGRYLPLVMIKGFITRFGPMAVKAVIGVMAFNELMDLIGLGAPDGTLFQFGEKKKKRRRYSIGANPRVRTLAKVSGHCKRLLKRHEKVIREFLPRKTRSVQAPSAYLSSVERAALNR
ncbi:hypothetical protein ES703_76314 [subsurface metagenome]